MELNKEVVFIGITSAERPGQTENNQTRVVREGSCARGLISNNANRGFILEVYLFKFSVH